MEITLKLLEDKSACGEGKEWFKGKFPSGGKYIDVLSALAADGKFDYLSWPMRERAIAAERALSEAQAKIEKLENEVHFANEQSVKHMEERDKLKAENERLRQVVEMSKRDADAGWARVEEVKTDLTARVDRLAAAVAASTDVVAAATLVIDKLRSTDCTPYSLYVLDQKLADAIADYNAVSPDSTAAVERIKREAKAEAFEEAARMARPDGLIHMALEKNAAALRAGKDGGA